MLNLNQLQFAPLKIWRKSLKRSSLASLLYKRIIQIFWKFVTSKIQSASDIIGSVSPHPAPVRFNYSSFTYPNTKITLIRGSSCQSVESIQKLLNIEIISPYSVSSEDSPGLLQAQEDKANFEIEAVDLISLFEGECGGSVNFPCFSPIKPAEIPNDLLPIINDCEIVLV